MNKELDKELCAKYPDIFKERNAPMNTTCMCWGFEHGDGWYDIIDSMCQAMTYNYNTVVEVDAERAIAWNIEPTKWGEGAIKYYLDVKCPQVVATQVKEKYGTLRFYFRLEFEEHFNELAYGENPTAEATKCAVRFASYIDGIVGYAECLSERTCEVTGKKGEMHSDGGWYRVLNREYAKSLVDKNYVAMSDMPDFLKTEETKLT